MNQTSEASLLDGSLATRRKNSAAQCEPAWFTWWSNRHRTILWALLLVFTIAGAFRLIREGYRLVYGPDWRSAVDLKLRHKETIAWFEGVNIYAKYRPAVYPPVVYVLLKPIIGYASLAQARWIWFVVLVICTAWLGALSAISARGRPPLEMAALAILPFAAYATSATFSTGQLIVALLPMIIVGVLLITRDNRWWVELIASAMIVVGLSKLTIALPFMWIVLFCARSYRPIIFIPILYLLVTAVGLSYQETPTLNLIHQWLANGRAEMFEDYGNLHSWLTVLGKESWAGYLSPLCGLLLGVWMWFHRRADVWILIGIASLFARLWTYHRLYDDLLALPAAIALYRLAAYKQDGLAALAFMGMVALLLAPSNRLNYGGGWGDLSRFAQQAGWIGSFVYLMWRARPELDVENQSSAAAIPIKMT